jgi:hypothetical protein
VAQAKRNQQQKVSREMQRDQERALEAYYKAYYKKKKKQEDLLRRSNGMSQSLPTLRSDRSGNEDGVLDSIQESHSLYTSTIDRWEQLVGENDGRARAHWRKIFRDSNYEHQYALPGKAAMKKTPKESTASKNVKETSRRASEEAISDDIQPTGIDAASTVKFEFGEGTEGAQGKDSLPQQFSLSTVTSTNIPAEPSATSSLSRWESQMVQVRQQAQEYEQMRLEQLRRSEASLAEARARIDSSLKARAAKASEGNQNWHEKLNEARLTKAAGESKDLEAALIKHKSFLKRDTVMNAEKQDELFRRFTAKRQSVQSNKMSIQLGKIAAEEEGRRRLAAKDRKSAHNYLTKMLEYERKVLEDREKFEERIRAQKENQARIEEYLSSTALEEIAGRRQRLGGSLDTKKLPVIEQCRAERRAKAKAEKEMARADAEQTLRSPGHSSPSSSPKHLGPPEETESPKGARQSLSTSCRFLIDYNKLLEPEPRTLLLTDDTDSLNSTLPMIKREVTVEETQAATWPGIRKTTGLPLRSPKHVSSTDGGGVDSSAAAQTLAAEGSDGQEDGSEESGPPSEAESDEGFLDELKTRSTMWLEELRNKREDTQSAYH